MEALARTTVRTRIPLMDLRREYHASRDELLAACERVLGRMQLIGGEEVRAFEAEMAAYLGVRHVRGVASGTDALWLAVAAAGVGPGDEVLVQANAFVAAVEAVQRAGARPVPVDIRLEDLGPDGLPVDLPPLLAFARERRLAVIEDCSHAHGATLDGRHVGSFGAAAAFSLGVVKNLAAYGDAGIVATDDGEVAERVRLLGNHGQAKKNEHAVYGANSRLDELQAAMLRVKLHVLDARNRRRAEIAAYYTERLHELVVTPPECPFRTAVYHQYAVRTPRRDALRAYLAERDIETGIHYPVPIHRQPAWLRTFGEGPALPRAERAAREILSLPVHPDLTDEEVEHVADAVRSFFRR
ncbi:MAG: DegT/DnrJ/EryC1/StrS family aminotransferase [Deltaproteobacteria bacterium]|nr:MAG: DegT/DnrJ/EryC1/StrS family aminotransferase [Deltaproteobacteria bacterium]